MNMKKCIVILSVFLIISILVLCGCTNETSNNGNPSNNNGPTNIFVDKDGEADFSTIQDAIDNASEGDIINVREGYYSELLSINKTITLIGEGSNNTIIEFNVTEGGVIGETILISADNCLLSGFEISCGEANNNIQGILIESSNNTISNNRFLFGDDGIKLGEDSKYNIIKNNYFSSSTKGIFIHYSEFNNISENQFRNASYFAIYAYASDSNFIANNNFSNNSACVRITGSEKNRVYGNTFINNDGGVLLCCNSEDNTIYYNNFISNKNWHASVGETLNNIWDDEGLGNYWDDYEENYQNATKKDGIWQTPYEVSTEANKDYYPLVNPIDS
jgi:parallel beta-helix repeat protein